MCGKFTVVVNTCSCTVPTVLMTVPSVLMTVDAGKHEQLVLMLLTADFRSE